MMNRRSWLTRASTWGGVAFTGAAGAQLGDAQPAAAQSRPPWFNVMDFGAVPDGATINTGALERTLKACSAAGGGTVYVPAGVFLSGPFEIPSRTTLHLDAGAVILAAPQLQLFKTEATRASGESARTGLVTARDAENVAIVGRGTIDGNGMAFQQPDKVHTGSDWDRKFTRQGDEFMDPKFGTSTGPMGHSDRPGNLLRFLNCRKVALHGVTIQNSPTWTILFSRCDDIQVDGLNINSLASGRRIGNDDGMDLRESTNIRISGCHIQTGDDCIAVFGSRNVVVSNCTLAARSAAIRVGYAAGDSRNCTFQNLAIESNCGLKVNVRDSGSVEDVLFSNIVMRTGLITGHWWGKGEPVNVSCVPMGTSGELGHIRRIHFSNILAESENSAVIIGSAGWPIEDVHFDNFDLYLRNSKLQPSYGGNFDLRGAADLSMALFKHDVPGLYFRHVHRLRLNGFRPAWDDMTPPFFSHAIEGEDFNDLEIGSFEGRQARIGAAIALRRGTGVSIRDCRAAAGCDTFLSQAGVAGQRLFVNNDLSRAKRAFEPPRHGFTASGNLLPKRS